MIKIPRLSISYNSSSNVFKLDHDAISFPIKKLEFNNMEFFVIGRPYINSSKDLSSTLRNINKIDSIPHELIRSINGEFLIVIYSKSSKKIALINDRFCSIPIYYAVTKNNFFHASINYFDISKKLREFGRIKYNKSAFYEFLWFRRLHHDITFDEHSKYLLPASILIPQDGNCALESYWMPVFKKSKKGFDESTDAFIQSIKTSIVRKTDDIETSSLGFFLSGGMDTRTILAALSSLDMQMPSCFTLGFSEEGEYRIASQLTNLVNAEHHFIKMDPKNYEHFWDEKFQLSGGIYHFLQNIFLGINDTELSKKNFFLHGHGFDYLFQGMYLPTSPLKILGRNTHIKKTINLNNLDRFIEFYASNVPYRAWRIDLKKFIKKDNGSLHDSMIDNLKNVERLGNSLSDNNFDIWEFMMIYGLSRHYSQTDVMGMATHGEQLKIANDNDLFDFYLSLPLEYRKYAKIMRAALKKMNNSLAKVPSANTDYKITAGPIETTSYFIVRSLLRRLSKSDRFAGAISSRRTWPNEDEHVRNLEKLKTELLNLSSNDLLRENLDFLDFSYLKEMTYQWLENDKPGGAQFLMCILAIKKYLEETS